MPSVASPFGLKAKSSPSGIIRPQRWVVPAADVVRNSSSWAQVYQDDAIYFDTNGRLQVSSASNTACVGSFQGVEFNDSNGRRTVSNQFNPGTIFNPVANQGLGTTDVWFWLYTDPELVYEVQVNVPSTATATTTAAASTGATSLAIGSTSGIISPGQQIFVSGSVIGVVAALTGTTVYLSGMLSAGIASGTALTFSGLGIVGVGNLLTYNQGTGQNAVTGFSTGSANQASTTTAGGGSFVVYNVAYDNQPNNAYVPGAPTAISGNTIGDPYMNVLVRLANAQFNGALPQF